jgi:predicted metal-binding protein
VNDTVHGVLASKAEVMRHYDPVRIQGYCRACEKYGLFWSCPPFDDEPLARLPEWTHAVLMTQKTWVDAGQDPIEQFMAARQILGETLRLMETGGAVSVIAGHCAGCSSCVRAQGLACHVPSRMRYSLEALGFDVTGLAEALTGQKMDWPSRGKPGTLSIVGALLCPTIDLAERVVARAS